MLNIYDYQIHHLILGNLPSFYRQYLNDFSQWVMDDSTNDDDGDICTVNNDNNRNSNNNNDYYLWRLTLPWMLKRLYNILWNYDDFKFGNEKKYVQIVLNRLMRDSKNFYDYDDKNY